MAPPKEGWFMENADAYCRIILLAAGHKEPLKQIGEEGMKGLIEIRKNIGYKVDENQPLYNTDTFAGYKLGKSGN